MTLPENHTLNTAHLTTHSPSVGTAPVAAYVRAPFRSKLLKITGILHGAITAADASVAVTINGGSTVATLTLANAGSAAGDLFSVIPASPVYLNEDDVIALTPSGATGASVAADFSVSLRAN